MAPGSRTSVGRMPKWTTCIRPGRSVESVMPRGSALVRVIPKSGTADRSGGLRTVLAGRVRRQRPLVFNLTPGRPFVNVKCLRFSHFQKFTKNVRTSSVWQIQSNRWTRHRLECRQGGGVEGGRQGLQGCGLWQRADSARQHCGWRHHRRWGGFRCDRSVVRGARASRRRMWPRRCQGARSSSRRSRCR